MSRGRFAVWLSLVIGLMLLICGTGAALFVYPLLPPEHPYPPLAPTAPAATSPGVRAGDPCNEVMQRTRQPDGAALWCNGTTWETP